MDYEGYWIKITGFCGQASKRGELCCPNIVTAQHDLTQVGSVVVVQKLTLTFVPQIFPYLSWDG